MRGQLVDLRGRRALAAGEVAGQEHEAPTVDVHDPQPLGLPGTDALGAAGVVAKAGGCVSAPVREVLGHVELHRDALVPADRDRAGSRGLPDVERPERLGEVVHRGPGIDPFGRSARLRWPPRSTVHVSRWRKPVPSSPSAAISNPSPRPE